LRHSWVVDILPYIDNQEVYDAWNVNASYLDASPMPGGSPGNAVIADKSIGILRCPVDPTTVPNSGNLSYVVNGGFSRWYAIPVGWNGGKADGQSVNGGVLRWAPGKDPWKESLAVGKKLGVMFLGTHTSDQPWDMRNTLAEITDGTATTLLLGENTLAGYSKGTPHSGSLPTNWACPFPNFVMFLASDDVCRSQTSETDCLAGQLKPRPGGADGPGWPRANHRLTFERINYGANLTVKGSFPFANSGHPGGSNFAFCDGSVRFLSESLDGAVYARLITPGGLSLHGEIREQPFTDHSWKRGP
jgi:prepilin-type processing-associated H-X9-DG protein